MKPTADSYNSSLHSKLALWIARCGSTDEEIAAELGIDSGTFNAWKKIPEFASAIEDGRNYFATLAAESMQKLLKGYEVDERMIDVNADGTPKSIKTTTRHIPPNAQAVIFQIRSAPVYKLAAQIAAGGCPSVHCPLDPNGPFGKI